MEVAKLAIKVVFQIDSNYFNATSRRIAKVFQRKILTNLFRFAKFAKIFSLQNFFRMDVTYDF